MESTSSVSCPHEKQFSEKLGADERDLIRADMLRELLEIGLSIAEANGTTKAQPVKRLRSKK